MDQPHRIWNVAELRDNILEAVDEKKDCAVAALVSKEFWSSATRHLWRRVDFRDVLYLFRHVLVIRTTKCPTCRFSADMCSYFSRPLSNADWKRFRLYAPFIREIDFRSRYNCGWMFTTLQELARFPLRIRNWPNLQQVNIQLNRERRIVKKNIGALDIFLLPSVEILYIGVSGLLPQWNGILSNIFHAIQFRMISLNRLAIKVDSKIGGPLSLRVAIDFDPKTLKQMVSGLQARAQQLLVVVLDIGGGCPPILVSTTARLPNVLKAHIFHLPSFETRPSEVLFPETRNLRLIGHSRALYNTLKQTSTTSLDMLDIAAYAFPSGDSSGEELRRALSLLDRFPNVKLTTLRVLVLHETFDFFPSNWSSRVHRLYIDSREVELALKEEDLELIARSCPRLTHLAMVENSEIGPGPSLIVTDLQVLGQHCPALSYLSIRVQGTLSETSTTISHPLRQLRIALIRGARGTSSASDLTNYLRELMPNVRLVGSHPLHKTNDTWKEALDALGAQDRSELGWAPELEAVWEHGFHPW